MTLWEAQGDGVGGSGIFNVVTLWEDRGGSEKARGLLFGHPPPGFYPFPLLTSSTPLFDSYLSL